MRWRPVCSLDPRGTALFLRACVGLGFLQESSGRFENTPVARMFLVSRSPAFMGNVIRYSDQLYADLGQPRGRAAFRPAGAARRDLPGRRPGSNTQFRAGHARARARHRARIGPHPGSARAAAPMLDVGGGPGTYSVLLTERFPGLRSEVIELPGVAAVARELVAAAGASDRVMLRDGDYHSADFGSGKDVVLMSGMFHRETEQACRGLIATRRGLPEPRRPARGERRVHGRRRHATRLRRDVRPQHDADRARRRRARRC